MAISCMASTLAVSSKLLKAGTLQIRLLAANHPMVAKVIVCLRVLPSSHFHKNIKDDPQLSNSGRKQP